MGSFVYQIFDLRFTMKKLNRKIYVLLASNSSVQFDIKSTAHGTYMVTRRCLISPPGIALLGVLLISFGIFNGNTRSGQIFHSLPQHCLKIRWFISPLDPMDTPISFYKHYSRVDLNRFWFRITVNKRKLWPMTWEKSLRVSIHLTERKRKIRKWPKQQLLSALCLVHLRH